MRSPLSWQDLLYQDALARIKLIESSNLATSSHGLRPMLWAWVYQARSFGDETVRPLCNYLRLISLTLPPSNLNARLEACLELACFLPLFLSSRWTICMQLYVE